MTKSRSEIEIQLLLVRAQLAKVRNDGEDEALLYGAQQALLWALGEGMSPSNVWGVVENFAGELNDG